MPHLKKMPRWLLQRRETMPVIHPKLEPKKFYVPSDFLVLPTVSLSVDHKAATIDERRVIKH